MRYFDSLVHATPDGKWLGATRYDASEKRLLKETDPLQVSRSCLVAIAQHIDNSFVMALAREHPQRFVPIGSINPAAYHRPVDVARAVESLAVAGFAGLKLHPRLNGYDPLDDRCITAIKVAAASGLVVLLDTLFRQNGRPTHSAPDIIDQLANACGDARMILLHGGGSALLDLFEMVRARANLILDVSFTLLRYAGSSLDLDIRFLCEKLDQRVCVGSDFPEYTPAEAIARIMHLCEGVDQHKLDRVLFGNLDNLFREWTATSAHFSPGAI